MSETYLDRIIEHHRRRAAARSDDVGALTERAAAMATIRPFRAAIADDPALSVISEIKRRSPSKGLLRADLDPARLAGEYESAGATCLSVLTDEEYFGGSAADLATARAACGLPVLRKDFTVAPVDVVDARLMGADCVLLIAAALSPDELSALHVLARDIGLDVLVEIHDEDELAVAVDVGAQMIGVNQRDLVTFDVDTARAVRVAGSIPDGVVRVAESGIRTADDARRLRSAGYDAILVGESLVTASDPVAALRSLRV